MLKFRYSLFIFVVMFFGVNMAQFPIVCQQNLTTYLPAVCCPTPADSLFPCGGPLKGICSFITPSIDDLDAMELEREFLLDDRLGWPTRFFNRICICQGNYAGPDCGLCKFGWTGPNCSVKRPNRMRRNILTMTEAEQRIFRDRISLSKRTKSDWVIMNITSRVNADPINLSKLRLIRAPSVYDFFVYIHLYAARSTLVNERHNDSCNPARHKLDFAHKGPAFTTWHRFFVMEFEQALARLGTINSSDPIARRDGDDFSLPYWDWTGAQGCPICTNNIVGAIVNDRPVNETMKIGNIHSESPFSNWTTFCPQRPANNDCHICDPSVNWNEQPDSSVAGGPLWRNFSNPNIEPTFSKLPPQAAVDSCLDTLDYDVWPYRSGAGRLSFRDILEGFTDPLSNETLLTTTSLPTEPTTTPISVNSTANSSTLRNTSATTLLPINTLNVETVFMHNLVHSYFNGSWFDVATSPNDPIFWLHHCFVDKLFELWIRKHRPGPQKCNILKYPRRGCPAGHAAHSNMVPFFPPVENIDTFTDSRNLGYDYDTYLAGTTLIMQDDRLPSISAAQRRQMLVEQENVITTAVLASLGALALVGIIFGVSALRYRSGKKQMLYTFVPPGAPGSSKHQNISDSTQTMQEYEKRLKWKHSKKAEMTPLLANIS